MHLKVYSVAFSLLRFSLAALTMTRFRARAQPQETIKKLVAGADMNDPFWSEKLRLDDRICITTSDKDSDEISYTCTTRQEHFTNMENAQGTLYDMGVTQRIDGTEEEKQAIVEVLALMKDYFWNEVLVMPAYKGIRDKCQNFFDLCAFWAALGECESNRLFMVPNCAAACRLCLLHNSGMGERSDALGRLPKPS